MFTGCSASLSAAWCSAGAGVPLLRSPGFCLGVGMQVVPPCPMISFLTATVPNRNSHISTLVPVELRQRRTGDGCSVHRCLHLCLARNAGICNWKRRSRSRASAAKLLLIAKVALSYLVINWRHAVQARPVA